jgi:hypothetical protein
MSSWVGEFVGSGSVRDDEDLIVLL